MEVANDTIGQPVEKRGTPAIIGIDDGVPIAIKSSTENSDKPINLAECFARISAAERALADVRHILSSSMGTGYTYASEDLPKSMQSTSFAPTASKASAVDVLDKSLSEEIFADAMRFKKATFPEFDGRDVHSVPLSTKVRTVIDNELQLEDSELAVQAEYPELAAKHGLTEEKVSQIHRVFKQANTSRSGVLSLDELEGLLADMCDGTIEANQLSFIMDKFDVDKDENLSFEEFLHAFVSTPLMKVSHLQDELRVKGGGARLQLKQEGYRLQAEDWVQIIGCKTSSVRRHVEKEIEEAGSCLAMPWVFAMFILFFLSAYFHLGYEQLHAVDEAIYFDITENANFAFSGDIPLENGRMGHKNIFDVNSFADFWSWCELGITPIFWAEGWDISETRLNVVTRCYDPKTALSEYGWKNVSLTGITNATVETTLCPDNPNLPQRPGPFYANAQKGTYLYYNTVIGGVRLLQERTEAEDCPNSDDGLLAAIHKGLCVPDLGYFLRPEFHAALRTNTDLINQPGGETTYLPASASQKTIRSMLRQLENDVWFGPYSAKVEVLLTTYNAHLDIFTATYIWLFMNRGGHMYKIVEPVSTYLTTYRNPALWAIDIMLVLLVLKIIVEEGVEISGVCRKYGIKTGMRYHYIAPANFIDWLSVASFVVLSLFWLSHLQAIKTLRDALRVADPTVVGSFSTIADRDTFYDAVDSWAVSDNNLTNVMSIYPFIIGARFFKVFSLQPRLGVVTATLHESLRDLAHFAVVFGSIFLVFVTCAMVLFGQSLDAYANFGRATVSVFLLMCGDFDMEEMNRVGRHQTAVWFFMFTWLVNLIMLNMLLAIIMDVHQSVKAHIAQDAETLWSQLIEIIKRCVDVCQGNQVRMEFILDCLDTHVEKLQSEGKDEERLTIVSFMAIVPSMPEKQGMRLLVNAYISDEEESFQGGSMSETSARVHHIFKNTHVLHHAISELMHMNETMAEMINANFAEVRYHMHSHQKKIRRSIHRSGTSQSSMEVVGPSTGNVEVSV